MGHVFDTARGIASVFQQRAAHCALCWFDSSDSGDSIDSCKDEPQAICGRVERSKQFEISDSSGFVFTAQLFVCCFLKFCRLPRHVCRTKKDTIAWLVV